MADEPTSPAEPEGGSTTTTTADEPAAAGKTYTQEELDRIVAQRNNKVREQFKDYQDLKKAADRLAEIEAANQTESEKLRNAAEKARQEAEEARQQAQAAQERARNTLVRAAVVSEASRQRAVDPDAVYALLDRSQIQVDDDDKVQGVEDAVKALLDERSYLLGRPNGGFDGGARTTAPAQSSRADLNAKIRREAGFG